LRLKSLPSSLLELIVRGGAQSLAIAPEAGSKRLRRAINKGFNEADILAAVERVAQKSLRQLKLYFMIGLPGETEEDIEAIINLAIKCQEIARGSAMRLSLNIAPFVPKAGTAFQRSGMADVTTLEKRIARLHDSLDSQGVEVKSESPQWSHVQGALSRGDTRMTEVLASIEKPSLAGWRRAVKKSGLDIEHYVKDNWEGDAPLPWSMVS
jgi:radical SAM superfamily enzyme YgiQ (UPF0313 family)